MNENWEEVVAEQIRQQAASGERQDEKIVAGPIAGDLNIFSD